MPGILKPGVMRLRTHVITLQGKRVVLRPMTEEDWSILLQWNSDPEVLYFSEGDDVQAYTLEQIQEIYRGVSQKAFCFIAEVNQQPIGKCWLQEMNLPTILQRHPGQDCRRIDLMIGEKALWGHGLGERNHCAAHGVCFSHRAGRRSLWMRHCRLQSAQPARFREVGVSNSRQDQRAGRTQGELQL